MAFDTSLQERVTKSGAVAVLTIDDDTGVTDVEIDPRNPDVIYAATYQRRRHIWSLLAGGPGSGIHKSTNGGESWRRLETGLPKGDMGKIGLAVSPADPDVVYATIEANEEERGFYRSRDRGEKWERRNDYISGGTGPHYDLSYQEYFSRCACCCGDTPNHEQGQADIENTLAPVAVPNKAHQQQ